MLKSIELAGFKSFAKKSELVFNAPISAIVGPNGSGKSNVAEAFRFVLGEQSMKSLRGKKGEDLIFNGAGDGSRSNRASVKVIFDNTRRVFPSIDFDEVSVERVVHRDGVNEYRINGSEVRLKDIVELLSVAHIGASGHHIISQGEADRILSASPKDRRGIIEEALGLKVYQYKREESERKLEKTAQNIQSVESLRKEIAPHLRFLKKQVEKIEKAVLQKGELVVLAQEYLKRERIFLDTTKSRIETTLLPLKEKEKQLQEELAHAKKVLAESTKDAKREEVIALETSLHAARKEKDGIMYELGVIRGEISAEERNVIKQKELLQSEEGKLIPLSHVEALHGDIKEKIGILESSEDISSIRSILSEIRQLFLRFIEDRKTKIDDTLVQTLEVHIDHLKTKKRDLEELLKISEEKEKKVDSEYRAMQLSIEKEKDSNRDAEKALFRIMSEENSVRAELALILKEEENFRYLEEEFKRELEECALLAGREVLQYKEREVVIDEHEPRSTQEERRRVIEKVKIRLEEAGVSGSTELMKEFEETSERDAFLERELHDLTISAESLQKLIQELGETLDKEFKEGIEKINNQFGEFFSTMFGGGTAKLVVLKEKKKPKDGDVDIDMISLEEESSIDEGIEIEVSLPKKKIKGLMMLSGGERALTSIALLFAMSQVNPPPFIILDETDAALDEANSKKYGDMIEGLSQFSQLILITHNRETMSRAGIIYGVTMGLGGISKILSIQFEEATRVAK